MEQLSFYDESKRGSVVTTTWIGQKYAHKKERIGRKAKVNDMVVFLVGDCVGRIGRVSEIDEFCKYRVEIDGQSPLCYDYEILVLEIPVVTIASVFK